MNGSAFSYLHPARRWTACLWGLACISIFAAPALMHYSFTISSSFVYLFFSRLCHQIPERSFCIFGMHLAVCHRCTGIYIGLLLGSLININWTGLSARRYRNILIAALALLSLDALLPFAGLWQNTPSSRFLTGLFFGAIASQIFMRSIAEIFHEISGRRRLTPLHLNGGSL
jgi:uncharacterized membrane protein